MIHPIAIINQSTVVSDDEAKRMAEAFDIQVRHQFGPVWGIGAMVSFVPKGKQPPPRKWWLVLLDNSDQAGALGYHDLTPEGFPIGKVFAATDQKLGQLIPVTLSHEGLEMLADPYINLTVQGADGKTFYAYENCDAVEADSLAIPVDVNGVSVPMSNFVHPRWFDATAAEGVQFDQGNQLTAPFQLLPGGYIGVWTPEAGWQQHQMGQPAPGDRPRVGSRRERRRTPRSQWLHSDINTSYKAGASPTPMGLQPVEEQLITK